MELINTPTISFSLGNVISASSAHNPYNNYRPYSITTTKMETEELWDFVWVYLGDDEEEEEFPHEGRVFGTKSEVEKALLVEFARLYNDVDVEDYELKLRKW